MSEGFIQVFVNRVARSMQIRPVHLPYIKISNFAVLDFYGLRATRNFSTKLYRYAPPTYNVID